MRNVNEFLQIFNKIEVYIRKLVNSPSYIPFSNLIEKSSQINPTIKEYANDLRELAELRNALVHEKRELIFAEVTDIAVDFSKKIYELIINPPLAIDIANKPVYCCSVNDNLLEQLKIMKENIYTHVPIYNGNNFIGILSESSIFNWLGDIKDFDRSLANMKIRDIEKYLDIYNRSNEYFEFVTKNENVYLIKQWFIEAIKNQKRLGAVFITEDGTQNGEILGIITAWDLPKIDRIHRIIHN
jgi:predicted transcriptional regulator